MEEASQMIAEVLYKNLYCLNPGAAMPRLNTGGYAYVACGERGGFTLLGS